MVNKQDSQENKSNKSEETRNDGNSSLTIDEIYEVLTKINFTKKNLNFLAGMLFVLSSNFDAENQKLSFSVSGETFLEAILLFTRIVGDEDSKFMIGFVKEVNNGLNKLEHALRLDLKNLENKKNE